VALGVAAGPATAATSHPAARPVAAHASQTVVFNCLKHAQVRPKSFVLTCADGNDYLTGLSWSSWTPVAATATGKQLVNDCEPYCAKGKFHSYPTMIVFWRPEPVAHHPGEKSFSRVTLLYLGARPTVYTHGKPVAGPDSWTRSLWS
jgi:hypothetical protein